MPASFPLTFHDNGILARKCRQDVELDIDQLLIIRILCGEGISVTWDRKMREQGPTHIPRFMHILRVHLLCCFHEVTNCLSMTPNDQQEHVCVTDECLVTVDENQNRSRSNPASPFRRAGQIHCSPSSATGQHARSLYRIFLARLQVRQSEVSLDIRLAGSKYLVNAVS